MDIQWPLVFFTLLTGLGAGTFAFVAISEWWGKAEQARLSAAIVALGALAAAGLASVLHLGHPERIFNALGHPGSGIFFEMLFVGLTGLAALVYIIASRANSSAQVRKTIATVGLVLGVVAAVAVGSSYVLPSRPAWHTVVLPLVYLASAAVLGSFCFSLCSAVRKDGAATAQTLNRVQLVALAVQAIVIVAYLVYLAAAPYQNPNRSVLRLLGGDLAASFWVGMVLVGLVAPAVLAFRALKAKTQSLSPLMVTAIGLICVILGGIAFRAPMYLIGTSIEKFF